MWWVQECGLKLLVTAPEEGLDMFSWSGCSSGDSPFVEVPLIISREQMLQLEALANIRGQSVGSLVRHLLNNSLARLKEIDGATPGVARMRSSA